MAQKKQIQVFFEMDNTVHTLQADGRRLKQILVNLLTNAVKFTPQGGQVGLSVVGLAETDELRMTVWDTGIGISAQGMSQLFQPFVQLDSSLSRQYEGTGLGLALVRRLAELHGGTVTVESEGIPGKGSRFTVSLPWRQTTASESEKTPSRGLSAPESLSRSVDSVCAGLSVLLADDNEANIVTIQDYLESKGYCVTVARNGAEAVRKAAEAKPDVILMDIQMPEMDGLEAIARIRADTKADMPMIPIIALTALAMPGDRDRCLKAGANEYLSKPVSLKGLVKVIQAQCSAGRVEIV
jgi:CheY-like chemotaxis protein